MAGASQELNAADVQLAQRAVEKLKTGQQLTAAEGKAHARVAKFQEKQARTQLLHAVPQWVMAEMCSGDTGKPRQCKQLQDMERQWGLPFARETINLYEFFPKLWEFLIRWGPLLKVVMEDADGSGDENSLGVRYLRAKIAKTEEDARAAAIRNDLRQDHLVERAAVQDLFGRLVGIVRQSSDRAQARWGVEGYDFVAGLIEGFDAVISGVRDGIGAGSIETTNETDSSAEDERLEVAAI